MKILNLIVLTLVSLSLYGQGKWITDKNNCKIFDPDPGFGMKVLWTGNCHKGFAEGKGSLIWYRFGIKTQRSFQGELQSGKFDGEGMYKNIKGTSFTGTFKDGHFIRGIKKEVFRRDTYVYEGEFKDDYIEGFGKLSADGLYNYVGEFAEGIQNGKGKMKYESGEIFIGLFEAGHYKKGTLSTSFGLKIEGDFKGFYPYFGTIFYSDSSKYVGEIKRYVPHGEGTLYLTDGGIFRCNWKKRTAEGPGEYKLPDGVILKGSWKDGDIDGKGEIVYPDGRHHIGFWKKGKLIREINGT